jgi:hypothetical protein
MQQGRVNEIPHCWLFFTLIPDYLAWVTKEISMSSVVMREGVVDFARYPDAAIHELTKYSFAAVDRTTAINKIRNRLLQLDGNALKELLHDLHDAAARHGVKNVVELTEKD